MSALDIEKERAECEAWHRSRYKGRHQLLDMELEAWLAAKRAAQPAVAGGKSLLSEALAVFDLMLVGCREQKFGDYENGDGETIGPRMDALHAKLRAHVSGQGGEDARLLDELRRVRDWFEAQRKVISKGCGSSWDMGQCWEQIESIDAAIASTQSKEAVNG